MMLQPIVEAHLAGKTVSEISESMAETQRVGAPRTLVRDATSAPPATSWRGKLAVAGVMEVASDEGGALQFLQVVRLRRREYLPASLFGSVTG